jgi:hypothetical protein
MLTVCAATSWCHESWTQDAWPWSYRLPCSWPSFFPAKCGGSNYVLNLPVLHHSGVMVHLHDGHREQPCEKCEQDASKEVRLPSDPVFPSEEVEHLSHADDESDRTQTKSARPCRKYRCPRRIVGIRLGYRKSDVRCSGQLERR